MLRPVAVVQAGNHHAAGLGARGVDELIVAKVDANMGYAVLETEKHQITRMQIMPAYEFAELAQGKRTVRDYHPFGPAENITHKSAAVEAADRAAAAAFIQYSLEVARVIEQIHHRTRYALLRRRVLLIGSGGHAAEQQGADEEQRP